MIEAKEFCSRVGKSLLKNVDIDILVVSSMKEFEKLAGTDTTQISVFANI